MAPPLTTHCRLCEKCYSHVDHHCLYLYKCIAKNNHRLFIFFNLVVMASMLMFEFSCVLYVNIFFPGRTLDGSLVYELFASYPCLWALFVLNGQGLIWGVWLMKVQYNVISKGRILSYSKYTEKSHLSGKQKFLNVVYFVLNKEPYARDSVFNAWYRSIALLFLWLTASFECVLVKNVFLFLIFFQFHVLLHVEVWKS